MVYRMRYKIANGWIEYRRRRRRNVDLVISVIALECLFDPPLVLYPQGIVPVVQDY